MIIQKLNFTLLIITFMTVYANAQISPPGLGDGRTASWFAVGARQDLNREKTWQSMSYLGFGRKSNPDNTDLLFKPAISVLNQEFYHPFRKHWQTSFALSYRRQQEYEETYPFATKEPSLQQEFRMYARLSRSVKIKRFTLTPTIRQEIRRFFQPNFGNTTEPLQFRSRLRMQLSTTIDAEKEHKLMLSSEQLFSFKQANDSKEWSSFSYNESRFMLYYSYSPKDANLIFDVGYMHNLIGKHAPSSVHYLAFDVILKNPFHVFEGNNAG